jgi:hypothetical protein
MSAPPVKWRRIASRSSADRGAASLGPDVDRSASGESMPVTKTDMTARRIAAPESATEGRLNTEFDEVGQEGSSGYDY